VDHRTPYAAGGDARGLIYHLAASRVRHTAVPLAANTLAAPARDGWGVAMKLLVLGGTRFLSREVAIQAVARGWEVTCACRGESGTVPSGAAHLRWDRAEEGPDALREGDWHAVVDVARLPSHVRRAVAAVPDAHWVFVSTINVYADDASPAMEPLVDPIHDDVDLATRPEAYGPMKVACEDLVRSGAASAMVVRPGLIAGPGDETGRFGYWPARLARGGEVLAPGPADDPAQVIDVRDMAAWMVGLLEDGHSGAFHAVSPAPPFSWRDELEAVRDAVAPEGTTLTWVSAEFLREAGVDQAALPLWSADDPEVLTMAADPGRATATGLRPRPLGETARDTLAWARSVPRPDSADRLSAEREAELLARWHRRR
jgi:2'-hydroxyisoflavone reductase